ncbi:hypothetical protein BJ878DRAFT_510105 [Calycina marina]|uniref:Ribosomal protein S21 n=1 Tax=Calycina marina TaxID=1763456 RepID=A0A9P8CE03_9HELO|nr:hypothetical protein BJ878DRAFT_510105 [Calycina marina]
MELRRVADALLRCPNSIATTLVTPTSTIRWQAARQLSCRTPQNHITQRSFSNSRPRDAYKFGSTTRSAAPPTESSVRTSGSESAQNIESRYGKDSTAARSGWLSGSKPARNQPRPEILNGSATTSDSILKAINAKNGNASNRSMDVSAMKTPLNDSGFTLQNMMKSKPNNKKKMNMVLKPSLGRTIEVGGMGGGSIDVARGFRLLEQSCARNKVRSDFTKQRFHERPGLKRKRLVRERWRRRFMEGFQEAISKVREMRRQGW